MKNYDELVEISHNQNWLYITDRRYIILLIGDSRSEKNQLVIELNRKSTNRHWKNLFTHQRSIRIKVPIT